jgi:hypothetical protein
MYSMKAVELVSYQSSTTEMSDHDDIGLVTRKDTYGGQ